MEQALGGQPLERIVNTHLHSDHCGGNRALQARYAGVETLVSEPRYTSHKGISPTDRAALGIPDGFLRLSCGIEEAEDIIGDLQQALER